VALERKGNGLLAWVGGDVTSTAEDESFMSTKLTSVMLGVLLSVRDYAGYLDV